MYQRGDAVYKKTNSIFEALDAILKDSMRKHALLSKLNAHKNELENILEQPGKIEIKKNSITKKTPDTIFNSKSSIFANAVNIALKVAPPPPPPPPRPQVVYFYWVRQALARKYLPKKYSMIVQIGVINLLRLLAVQSLAKKLRSQNFLATPKEPLQVLLQKRVVSLMPLKVGHFFIDEIGEMPIELQPKLLRALEERKFRRLGGAKQIKYNARIIAATHQDLKSMVKLGTFREDLYHRLSVIPIRIPALREHPEDIPDLINRFIAEFSWDVSLTDSAFAILCNYYYPGNIRELRNIVERLKNLCGNGETINADTVIEYVPRLDVNPISRKPKYNPKIFESVRVSLNTMDRDHYGQTCAMLDMIEGMKKQGEDHGKIGLKLFPNCSTDQAALDRLLSWLNSKNTLKLIEYTADSDSRWKTIMDWYENGINDPTPIKIDNNTRTELNYLVEAIRQANNNGEKLINGNIARHFGIINPEKRDNKRIVSLKRSDESIRILKLEHSDKEYVEISDENGQKIEIKVESKKKNKNGEIVYQVFANFFQIPMSGQNLTSYFKARGDQYISLIANEPENYGILLDIPKFETYYRKNFVRLHLPDFESLKTQSLSFKAILN